LGRFLNLMPGFGGVNRERALGAIGLCRFLLWPFDYVVTMSRELILSMSVSVDGFVAGPNGEIDWIFRNAGEASTQWLVDQLGQVSLHAMGHRAYLDMAGYWPTSSSPFARPMNQIPKAVFSRSGVISPPSIEAITAVQEDGAGSGTTPPDYKVLEGWLHPIVAGTDLIADIQRLKAEDGKPINALGGASFASSLIAAHLVDVCRLIVHPVILGRGLPIFTELENPLHLKLEDLKQFDTGVVAKTYRPQLTS
jgi:dihydrofolate reductase